MLSIANPVGYDKTYLTNANRRESIISKDGILLQLCGFCPWVL